MSHLKNHLLSTLTVLLTLYFKRLPPSRPLEAKTASSEAVSLSLILLATSLDQADARSERSSLEARSSGPSRIVPHFIFRHQNVPFIRFIHPQQWLALFTLDHVRGWCGSDSVWRRIRSHMAHHLPPDHLLSVAHARGL
jgi:hypothetical protein